MVAKHVSDDSSRADGAIDPWLGLAIFDPHFLSSIPQAFKCGLLSVQHFPALISHEVNIELVYINDAVHAVPPHPVKACADFQASNLQYATYRTTLTPLQEAGNSEFWEIAVAIRLRTITPDRVVAASLCSSPVL